MVIAGITIDKRNEKKLVKLGVKDSKQLSPKRREELAAKIEELTKAAIVLRVQPCIIDSYRAKKINLDKIEAMKMAEIIDMCSGSKVYVDSLTVNPNKFKQLILSYVKDKKIKDKKINLIAENYADRNYPVVAAASIIAKVNRDAAVKEIERKAGYPIGVGYPHDARTIEFVERLIKQSIKQRKKLPPYVRKSWVTTQLLQEKSWQRKIKDFIFRKKEKCREDKEKLSR